MKYFVDTEFLEDGKTIELLSIAVVAADGREFYRVVKDANWHRAVNDDWLRDNVLPSLPVEVHAHLNGKEYVPSAQPSEHWDYRSHIASGLKGFVEGSKPEFWGYYSDYDWVAICQLFGKMIALPPGFPMYCLDVKQLAVMLGNPELPKQDTVEHNALSDARWIRATHEWLMENYV